MQGEKKQFGSLLKASIPNLFRHTVIRVAGSEGGEGGGGSLITPFLQTMN